MKPNQSPRAGQAQHTPGPWTTEGHGGYERKRADGSPWRSLNVGTTDGATVAEVCVPNGAGWQDPGAQANARLIAAAPELLEALRCLVNIISHPKATRAECNIIAQEARAAIAKAEGQA